jgi:hypothetical protein
MLAPKENSLTYQVRTTEKSGIPNAPTLFSGELI